MAFEQIESVAPAPAGIGANRGLFLHNKAKPFISRTVPLEDNLQILSDLCIQIRLRPSFVQDSVLCDSIQRNIINPIRTKLDKTSESLPPPLVSASPTASDSFNPSALSSDYNDRYVVRLVVDLILDCCFNSEAESGTLHLSAFLDMLLEYIQAQAHVPHAYDALKVIWADVFSVFTAHLCRWLEHVDIEDPTLQFFISVEESSEESHLFVEHSNLPLFITHHMADMLIFIGTASKCANLLTSPSPSPRSIAKASFSLDISATIEKVQQHPLSTALIFEASCASWRAQAAEHLSQVLPFNSIAKRIRNLRDFLLQGNASFWRCVFDDMPKKTQILQSASEITEETRRTAERALNRLLMSVAVDAELDDDAPDEENELDSSSTRTASPLILQIAEDGALTPCLQLSLSETHVLGSSATVYCDVFAVTFGLRRTACKLREAFTYILQLERLMRFDEDDNIEPTGPEGSADIAPSKRRERRKKLRYLAKAVELRRCMMNFIESVEWYVQAIVIQPKFDKLLDLLERPSEVASGNPSRLVQQQERIKPSPSSLEPSDSIPVCPEKSFFDIVTEAHSNVMKGLFKECFVADEPINVRLNSILGICDNLSNFLCESTPPSVKQPNFAETIESLSEGFSRNVELFEQMLLVYNQSGESKVGSLLLRYLLEGNFRRKIKKNHHSIRSLSKVKQAVAY